MRGRRLPILLLPLLLLAGCGGYPGERGDGTAGERDGGNAAAAEPVLTLDFLDVGQGDAILIRTAEGHAVLYDGGPDPDLALRHLRELGVGRLDLVIASHNHADHIGGLTRVVEAYRPPFFIDNGLPHPTRTYERLVIAVAGSGTELLEPTARTITLGAVALRVLPPPGHASWEQNDNSVGVVVEMGGFRAFLGGDAEARQWRWWLEREVGRLAPVHVMKASHHGSRNGDTAEALARLAPAIVVIGVGEANPYGHPHAETLARYREAGARVLRTDLHGTVQIEVAAEGTVRVRVPAGVP